MILNILYIKNNIFMLRLENRDDILDIIENYCNKNKIDFHNFLIKTCDVVEEKIDEFKELDDILEIWMSKSNQSIYYAEEEIYSVVSIYLENIVRNDILKQINDDDYQEMMFFLNENYFKIFYDFYKKKNRINPLDFNDCVLSISKSYGVGKDVSEVFVSIFIEKNILKIEL